mmetsp:Transcript_24878/g.59261  ORF Transcript_24878/g.59261 Transcript_24878/m.59261 type:complete len:261 (-) Transcript_24878:357-1139(-)
MKAPGEVKQFLAEVCVCSLKPASLVLGGRDTEHDGLGRLAQREREAREGRPHVGAMLLSERAHVPVLLPQQSPQRELAARLRLDNPPAVAAAHMLIDGLGSGFFDCVLRQRSAEAKVAHKGLVLEHLPDTRVLLLPEAQVQQPLHRGPALVIAPLALARLHPVAVHCNAERSLEPHPPPLPPRARLQPLPALEHRPHLLVQEVARLLGERNGRLDHALRAVQELLQVREVRVDQRGDQPARLLQRVPALLLQLVHDAPGA